MATGKSESGEVTRIMMGVNASSIKGYRHASISSRGAFEWTLKKIIRSNTGGFKLYFLHVQVPDRDGSDDCDSIYFSPEEYRDPKLNDKSKGLILLGYFVKRCHEIGVACEAWIRKGDPRETICGEVRRVQPDLLVIGNRGLGPFQRIFIGTVSGYCVKHCECPVVAIKRSAKETPEDPADD